MRTRDQKYGEYPRNHLIRNPFTREAQMSQKQKFVSNSPAQDKRAFLARSENLKIRWCWCWCDPWTLRPAELRTLEFPPCSLTPSLLLRPDPPPPPIP